jgi:beta-glucosidase-like glycosyl hydrolase
MRISKKISIALLIAMNLMLGSCIKHPPVRTGLFFGRSEAKWVNKHLSKMTLKEKIGQMIGCGYAGRFVNRDSGTLKRLKSLTIEHKIGGFILYMGEVYETARLTNNLQKAAKIPLLIAADLERGLGTKITGATLFPPLMSLGAAGSEELIYQMGRITALEARSIGIHMTYSPVVDVNVNPDNPIINVRSLGEDPEQVGRLAASFIKGCQDFGLLATAKHFPGHGDTDMDSHSVLPTIEGDRDRLDRVELFPFKRAIEAGVRTIMTAHLRLPALDSTPDMPATLSKPIITDLLRKKLGFSGMIVTDAMNMGGITTLYSPGEAAIKAVQAGVDMILIPPEPENVIESLVKAVKEGIIQEKTINESVRRILEAKARLGLHKISLVDLDDLDKSIAKAEHIKQASLTFESSITLVKNKDDLLPLSLEGKKLAVFSLNSDPDDYYAGRTFIQEVNKSSPGSIGFYADAFTGQEFLMEAKENSTEADVLIFLLFSRLRAWKGTIGLNLQHVDFIKESVEGTRPVIVISFGSPYFLRHFPGVDAYICAYRHADEAQIAAAKAVFGEIDIKGKLPVSIPNLFPVGHGIEIFKVK